MALGLAIWAIVRNRAQEDAADPTRRLIVEPSSPRPAVDAEEMWR